MDKVLILGGYGNFGKRISVALAKARVPIIIAGRSEKKANILANEIRDTYSDASVEIVIFDVNKTLSVQLEKLLPKVVINTCGPFQLCDYSVAETCIKHNVNYIDLSDGREFVTNINSLDQKAKDAGVLVVAGASTVPGYLLLY